METFIKINFQLLIIGLLAPLANSDFYTSMSDVSALANIENDFGNIIEDYVKVEYRRLEMLKAYAKDHVSHCHELRMNNSLQAEPLNLFLIIKRLYWVQLVMKRNNAQDYLGIFRKRHSDINLPRGDDVIGAALALFRLQDTYKLSSKSLADGLLTDNLSSRPLTALECFELGKIAYELEEPDYYHTLLWMEEADRRVLLEKPPTLKREEILDYLSYAMYEQGNVERALIISKHIRELNPKKHLINENIEYYENLLRQQGISTRTRTRISNDVTSLEKDNLPPLRLHRDLSHKPPWFEQYEILCRGEKSLNQKMQSKLTCSYKENGPFLRLARLKVETVHLEPKIVLFKNVISDDESAAIQMIATPKFERAGVVRASGKFEASDKRTSKIAWLQDSTSKLVRRISRRVEDMTDLTCDTAEYLQVSNYGIGGHYEAHFDFTPDDATPGEANTFKDWNAGNRIATILFYLSQPLAGGATVFPDLNLTLAPSKNDAVFWYNLYKSGKGDNNLRHAACPVLSGIKWVANKWLHEYGQEYLRPCALDRYEYE